MTDSAFMKRLAILLSIDTLITLVDSYVPVSDTYIRGTMAAIQLVFMAITMLITTRRVLEDY